MARTDHPLIGKVVRWTHGQNVLVGPATHYDDDDDELFLVVEGMIHNHLWLPAEDCEEVADHSTHEFCDLVLGCIHPEAESACG